MKIDLKNKEEMSAIELIIENVPFVRTPTQAVRYALSKIVDSYSVDKSGVGASHVSKGSELK